MENVTHNASSSSRENEGCTFEIFQVAAPAVIDILTFLIGQPVILKLLWIVFTAKKSIDILNCNLALFHNLQYLMSMVHVISLFLLPNNHIKILKVLLVFAQIGGPMSLCFISLERYVAVIHPTSYPLLKKYRCREVCAVTGWLCSVTTPLAVFFPRESISSLTESVFKSIPFTVMVTMTVMMLWSSICISRALKKSGPGRDTLHPIKKKAFITVCVTTTLTMFCYIPVTLLQRFNFLSSEFKCIIPPINVMLLSAASVVHPLSYLSIQGKLCTCRKGENKAR